MGEQTEMEEGELVQTCNAAKCPHVIQAFPLNIYQLDEINLFVQ